MSARPTPLPKMPAQDFAAWIASMKRKHGWTQTECSRQLGVAQNSITTWIEKGAPRHIGLACAFLSLDHLWGRAPAPAKKDKAA